MTDPKAKPAPVLSDEQLADLATVAAADPWCATMLLRMALDHIHEQRLALLNVKALAKRMRRRGDSENAEHLLRFCEQGGCGESPLDILRDAAKPGARDST